MRRNLESSILFYPQQLVTDSLTICTDAKVHMLFHDLARRLPNPDTRLVQMAAHLINGSASNGKKYTFAGLPLESIPKSNTFTKSLPPDPKFMTPVESFKAHHEELGPRMVKGAIYTYVRPEGTEDPELLGVSEMAMRDLGLKEGEETKDDFKDVVAGNKLFWDKETETGIYPWAQCYGGTSSQMHRFRMPEINARTQDGNCTLDAVSEPK